LEFKPLRTGLERLVQFATLHNPQLKTLRRQRELAELLRQTAQETTRPTLSLNSTYNYTETSASLTRDWTLGGAANWLFFDSFVTRDNVSKAQIGVIIADLNLSDAERTTQLNINNAYLDLKNAEKQIQDFASSIDQARHNVEVVRLRFRNGLERLIDVFDAENDMRTLDNEYLNLVVSFNQQKDTLSQQVGADVETVP
jgi:outer membrane protein TolC